MKTKTDAYWPVFLIVAALGAAAIWRFAPVLPLPPEFRAMCVSWTHRARRIVGLESTPERNVAVAGVPADSPVSVKPLSNDDTPSESERPARESASSRPAPALAASSPSSRTTDGNDDDPLALSPAQRKARYAALTEKAEARRLAVLRENLAKSPEGKKALAALKAFKKKAAEVDELKKKYGETDMRVTRERNNILKLKDEVRRTNDLYKEWKAKNAARLTVPEEDPEYRKIIAERQLYAE